MDIELIPVTIRDLTSGYENNDEEGGVVGYAGQLNIRPPYQREFIYKDKQRDAVIETVNKGFPLNVMYWAVTDDGSFELIDGQQRTISICQYVDGDFSLNGKYFYNLQDDEQDQILNYETSVYRCTGTNSEKLDWFQTINIAGEKLTPQELRNAVFNGSWVSDAKRYFAKNGCAAYGKGGSYLSGSSIRQEYLQTVIGWVSNGRIDDYMGTHQHDPKALPLWEYFVEVIDWVEAVFPKYRAEMKGVPWGELYYRFGDNPIASDEIETRVAELMADDEADRKRGIYTYVFTGEEKWLNLRQFSKSDARSAYERQQGICPICEDHFSFEEMEADHKKAWRSGGKTVPGNCQMLCIKHNRLKSGY